MSTIHIKEPKKGSLHTALGIKQEDKIPASKLVVKESDSPSMVKKKVFAANARKWKHEFGGPLNEESLLGNKIENYPSEYVFDSYLNQPDQYGFGSWLKDNAGAVGAVVGTGIGTVIAPGIGTSIGANLGSTIGGSVQANDQQNDQDSLLQKQQLTQIAQNRMANGGYVNFGNSIGNQLIAPIAGSIQREKTQSEHDELGQKKVLSDLSGGRIEYGTGGNLKELSANWYLPKDTYGNGGNFDFMMANGGTAIQPRIDDVDGSNMKSPSTNTNIYTGGNSEFTERRGGIEIPNPDTAVVNSGETHLESAIGGTPIGRNALAEHNEVIYKDPKTNKKYVFSEQLKMA